MIFFPGHNTYMMSVAKYCREMGHFTDVTLQCYGKISRFEANHFSLKKRHSFFNAFKDSL